MPSILQALGMTSAAPAASSTHSGGGSSSAASLASPSIPTPSSSSAATAAVTEALQKIDAFTDIHDQQLMFGKPPPASARVEYGGGGAVGGGGGSTNGSFGATAYNNNGTHNSTVGGGGGLSALTLGKSPSQSNFGSNMGTPATIRGGLLGGTVHQFATSSPLPEGHPHTTAQHHPHPHHHFAGGGGAGGGGLGSARASADDLLSGSHLGGGGVSGGIPPLESLKHMSAKEVVAIEALMSPAVLQEAFDIIIFKPIGGGGGGNTANNNSTLRRGGGGGGRGDQRTPPLGPIGGAHHQQNAVGSPLDSTYGTYGAMASSLDMTTNGGQQQQQTSHNHRGGAGREYTPSPLPPPAAGFGGAHPAGANRNHSHLTAASTPSRLSRRGASSIHIGGGGGGGGAAGGVGVEEDIHSSFPRSPSLGPVSAGAGASVADDMPFAAVTLGGFGNTNTNSNIQKGHSSRVSRTTSGMTAGGGGRHSSITAAVTNNHTTTNNNSSSTTSVGGITHHIGTAEVDGKLSRVGSLVRIPARRLSTLTATTSSSTQQQQHQQNINIVTSSSDLISPNAATGGFYSGIPSSSRSPVPFSTAAAESPPPANSLSPPVAQQHMAAITVADDDDDDETILAPLVFCSGGSGAVAGGGRPSLNGVVPNSSETPPVSFMNNGSFGKAPPMRGTSLTGGRSRGAASIMNSNNNSTTAAIAVTTSASTTSPMRRDKGTAAARGMGAGVSCGSSSSTAAPTDDMLYPIVRAPTQEGHDDEGGGGGAAIVSAGGTALLSADYNGRSRRSSTAAARHIDPTAASGPHPINNNTCAATNTLSSTDAFAPAAATNLTLTSGTLASLPTAEESLRYGNATFTSLSTLNNADLTSRSNQLKSFSRAGEAKGLQKQIKKKQVKELAEKQLNVMLRRAHGALRSLHELQTSEDFKKLPEDSPLRRKVKGRHEEVMALLKAYNSIVTTVNIHMAEMGLPALVIDSDDRSHHHRHHNGDGHHHCGGGASAGGGGASTAATFSHHSRATSLSSDDSNYGCSPLPSVGVDKLYIHHPGYLGAAVGALTTAGNTPTHPTGTNTTADSSKADPSSASAEALAVPRHPPYTGAGSTPTLAPPPAPAPMIGVHNFHGRQSSRAHSQCSNNSSASSEERLIEDDEAEAMAKQRRSKCLEVRAEIAKINAAAPSVVSDDTFIRENIHRIVPHSKFMPFSNNSVVTSTTTTAGGGVATVLPASVLAAEAVGTDSLETSPNGLRQQSSMFLDTATTPASSPGGARGSAVSAATSPVPLPAAATTPPSSVVGSAANGTTPNGSSALSSAVEVSLRVGEILSISKEIIPSQGKFVDCRVVSNGHGPDGLSYVLLPLRKIDSSELLFGSDARAAAFGGGRVLSGNGARILTWFYEATASGESTILCKETQLSVSANQQVLAREKQQQQQATEGHGDAMIVSGGRITATPSAVNTNTASSSRQATDRFSRNTSALDTSSTPTPFVPNQHGHTTIFAVTVVDPSLERPPFGVSY